MTKRNSKGQFAKATPVEPKERPIEDWLGELPEPYRAQALEARKGWPSRSTTATSLSNAIMNGFLWARTPQNDKYWSSVYWWGHRPTNNELPTPWSPPAPKGAQDYRDAPATGYHLSVSDINKSLVEMNNKLDQVQQDIDLLKSGSSFMQELDKMKGQPEEQGLEEGDYIETTPEIVLRLRELGLWRREEGSVYLQYFKGRIVSSTEDMLKWEVSIIKHRPDFLARAAVTARKLGLKPVEQPKEEPWVPKVGDVVVVIKDERHYLKAGEVCTFLGEFAGDASVRSLNPSYLHGYWVTPTRNLRPATPEEIAKHQAEKKAKEEDEEKRKKLIRGCRVRTPDGDGIYLGDDGDGDGCEPHRASLDLDGPGVVRVYNLDQITPLP